MTEATGMNRPLRAWLKDCESNRPSYWPEEEWRGFVTGAYEAEARVGHILQGLRIDDLIGKELYDLLLKRVLGK